MELKRTHYLALGLITVLTLVLMNLSPTAAGLWRLAISSLFLPLHGLSASEHQLIDRLTLQGVPRRSLLLERERLQRENEQLKLQINQNAQAEIENARLRQAVGWTQRSPWKSRLKLARITARDPSTWWRSGEIDLGERDGLKNGLPVLTADGLVGRTTAVGPHRTRISFIGDPSCGAAVLIDQTRDAGVITGSAASTFEPGIVEVTYLPKNPSILLTHTVSTSGLGAVFPKGIPIGKIIELTTENTLYVRAKVQLAVNLNQLEEVWVLLP